MTAHDIMHNNIIMSIIRIILINRCSITHGALLCSQIYKACCQLCKVVAVELCYKQAFVGTAELLVVTRGVGQMVT